MSDLETTRRDFLWMAGMGAAGASLVTPSKLFSEVGGVKPEKILVAADAHPAIQAAAKILAKKLFQYDKAMKISMYRVPLGEPGPRYMKLGNPRSLMHQIYSESLAFVEESVGVDYVPKEWIRGTAPKMNVHGFRSRPL